MLIHKSLQELTPFFAIPGAVHFEDGENLQPMMTLSAPGGEARVYLHGAHVTQFTPAGHDPLLFVSRAASYEEGRGIRGGVPIVFPWFGPKPEDPDGPSHGVARTRRWELIDTRRHSHGEASATFRLRADADTLHHWPHNFELTYTVTVGRALALALTVTNPSTSEAFTFEEALHTYFAVSDIHHTVVTGLENARYLDKLEGGRELPQGDGPIRFHGETDRVYLDTPATCTVEDRRKSRRILIEKANSHSTVVWNPWEDKARRLLDLGNTEWPHFVCVESGNIASNAVKLEPGDSHTMEVTLRAEKM